MHFFARHKKDFWKSRSRQVFLNQNLMIISGWTFWINNKFFVLLGTYNPVQSIIKTHIVQRCPNFNFKAMYNSCSPGFKKIIVHWLLRRSFSELKKAYFAYAQKVFLKYFLLSKRIATGYYESFTRQQFCLQDSSDSLLCFHNYCGEKLPVLTFTQGKWIFTNGANEKLLQSIYDLRFLYD